jgi:RNA polymerase sigma factor (sigma-70 family)
MPAHPGLLREPLHKWIEEQALGHLADRELLERFLTEQDEAAFTALVQRYGPLVLRVAGRVLGHRQDSEDVFQATFLLLARKAAAIRNQDSVSCWLYGVAHRLAVRLKAQSRRQRALVPSAGRSVSEPAREAAAIEFCAILDTELKRLPDPYQAPVLLCGLEGKTRDEAAAHLGWSLGTFKRRLEKGRQLLRVRLARRGLLPSAALCANLLVPDPSPAASLVTGTVQASLRAATGAGSVAGLVSDRAVALVQGFQRALVLTRVKLSVALLVVLGVIAAGAGSWLGPKPTPQAPADEALARTAAGSVLDAPLPQAEPAAARTLRVVVLDPQGKPLPGAKVHASVWTEEKGFKANRDFVTDAGGAVQVELPKTFTILRLWANRKPFVPMFANWEQNELASGKPLPAEYTFRLESAVSAGGRLVDEQGQPIAGARVQVMTSGNSRSIRGDGRARYDTWLATGTDAATTDAQGRWHIDNVPDHAGAELSLLVTHPEYISDEHWADLQRQAGVSTAMLRQKTATLTLKRGVRVTGRVTDPAGKPVKDALVILGDDPYFASTGRDFPTDADGRYRLPPLAGGETTLTVVATGWAPQMRHVRLQAGMAAQDFRLEPGKPIRLLFVDGNGKPIPDVYVSLREWKGKKSLLNQRNPNHPKVPDPKIPQRADKSGVWNWPWAPDDPVKLEVSKSGFAPRELQIAGGTARDVTLKAEHHIVGRVTDAVTGKAIPSFAVIPVDVFRKDFLHAERFNAVPGSEGRLSYVATRTDIPLRLRIEAAGYRTQVGPEFRVGDDGTRTQDFRLQPGPPITGVVQDADGRPVAKASVFLATPIQNVSLSEDETANQRTFTDAAGRFTFPDPGEPWAVVARADAGFASVEFASGQHNAGTLRLRRWASVRGQFRDGGQPVRGATVLLQPIRVDRLDRPRIDATLQVRTGADGRFEFPRVPPGPVSVAIYLGPWKDEGFRSGPRVPLDLQPGEHATLDLGGAGAVVRGKVKLTGNVPADLDCTYSLNYLVRRGAGIPAPPALAGAGFDARHGWRNTWQLSSEGRAYLSTLPHWFVKLAADGSFRISGVPPGAYDLAVEVYARPSGCLTDPLAQTAVPVTVTAADAARGELVLPDIAAAVVPVPAIGAVPELAFLSADGTRSTLADHRGRYTLVHFWASWCGPCKQQLPALDRLHERFASRGLAMLGLALDDDATAWQAALTEHELPWLQGRLAGTNAAGVSSVPAYWLLDPSGKLMAKGYDLDEMASCVAERLK